MKKIWLVTQESNVDGQILFNVVPCASKKKAQAVMKEEINTLLSEGHFKDVFSWEDGFTFEETKTSWYISDEFDDYYEHINIEEKEIQY